MKWLTEGKYTPGYLNNIVNTVKKFFTFVEVNKTYQIGWVSKYATLDEYSAVVSKMSTFLSKKDRERKVINDDETGLDTIDKEAWNGYEESQCWKDCLDDIKRFQENPSTDVPHERHVYLRNQLLLSIVLLNFRRAGDLSNFNLDEFRRGKLIDGDMVCTVRMHKTKKKGAAPISMSIAQYNAVKDYITFVRPSFKPRAKQLAVFVNSRGKLIGASGIAKYIREAWSTYSTELSRDIGGISTTRVRRSAVTVTRQAMTTNEEQVIVAGGMCHDVEVANNVYDRSGQKEKGQKASRIVTAALKKVL